MGSLVVVADEMSNMERLNQARVFTRTSTQTPIAFFQKYEVGVMMFGVWLVEDSTNKGRRCECQRDWS